MTATRFVLLLLLGLSLTGCQGAANLVAIALDRPDNRKVDPNNSYDPYGFADSARQDEHD
jgi:hypothetical protein